jgi:hypothetical protein
MANPIRSWADLAEPDIHELDFDEELPAQLVEVARLVGDEAGLIEAAADSGAKSAEHFNSYVQYHDTAGIDGSVLAPLVDASEEINSAVAHLRQAAEAMARAANATEQAQRAADAVYTDFDMPRFDKANAG